MKVDRTSSDIKAGLVVFTGGQHAWAFSEPDEDGLRQIYFDGQEEGKGILLGVVIPIALGYMTQSSDVEVGRPLGIKFPDRPEWKCVLISTPVTAIIVMAKQEIAVVSGQVKKERKMAEDRRGPISGFVGDIPVANSYFSGDLTKMTKEQLQARLNELVAVDSDDEDSDEAFANRMGEMDAIQAELKRR